MTDERPQYCYDYPKADHTVDAVVFGIDVDDRRLKVLLVERGQEPFAGSWALPGGFIHLDESLDRAVRRELEEETGVELSYLEQLYTFDEPGRDPRGRVISTAFLGLVRPDQFVLSGGSDARRAEWKLAEAPPPLAFDHAKILDCGLQRLRSKLRWRPVGIELLGSSFTLTDLQRVYETILGTSIDKRNFRRKVLSFELLVDTGKTTQDGHRPAKLYRFDKKKYQKLNEEGLEFEV